MEAEEQHKLNQYALSFDAGCVDQLASVLRALKQSSTKELEAWRQKSRHPKDNTVEEKIRSLLFKIKRVHDSNKDSKISRHVSRMIGTIWKEFFDKEESYEAKVLLKCYFGEGKDIRVVEVPKTVSYTALLNELQAKYGTSLVLTYLDDEGDPVTIDSQQSLAAAFDKYFRDSARTLKLRISAQNPLVSPIITPSPSLLGSPITTPRTSPPGSPVRQRKLKSGSVFERPADRPSSASSSSSSSSSSAASSNGGEKSSSTVASVFFPLATPNLQGSSFSLSSELDLFRREETKALFEQLEETTHFSKEELEQLYSNWQGQAKDGCVGREEFEEGLKAIGITDPLILEQNFSAFDHNKDGKINFREFVTGLSIVQKGTMEERLRCTFTPCLLSLSLSLSLSLCSLSSLISYLMSSLSSLLFYHPRFSAFTDPCILSLSLSLSPAVLFDAYDVDGSGTLTPDEVYNIFQASLRSKGQSFSREEIRAMVSDCFKKIGMTLVTLILVQTKNLHFLILLSQK
ncbi:NADPH oxidase 5 [Balamuthia mandrillaris]